MNYNGNDMGSIRKPTEQEKQLLELLVKKSSKKIPNDWDKELLVCSMADGNMGSLYLFPQGKIKKKRLFGEQISEIQFVDNDNVLVVLSLNVDNEGNLFELDV